MATATTHQRLAEISVFAERPMIFGVPRDVFVSVLLVTVAFMASVAWWFGLAVALVVFPPLYRGHQSDPAAMAVWLAALRDRVLSVDPACARYLTVRFD